MTQPEEGPAEPPPPQPAEPVQPPHPTEPLQFLVSADGAAMMPGPEEQAAAAAKKAGRRMVFAKSAALAVPAVFLVALLAATGIQATTLSSKTAAASTAAKSANAADDLAAQLHAAQSAAEASILVDAGCAAVESQATQDLGNKLSADTDALNKAEKGSSFSAFGIALGNDVKDLQAFTTSLEQDAELSGRASVKSAISAVDGDLKELISATQDVLAGDFSNSTLGRLDSAGNRLDGDSTAVDTMCGGGVLGGVGGASSGGGSGTASA